MTLAQNLDSGKIAEAIIASNVGGPAKEEGSRLAETFLNNLDKYPDTQWTTVAVEQAWWMKLSEKTLVVGVQDRLAYDHDGRMHGFEWKSHREPKLKKDGQPYAGDTEQDWLDDISQDVQLRIYALAMQKGTYLDAGKLEVPEPRIVVRAVIKATPAYLWPTKPETGIFTFPQQWIDITEAGLLSAAEQIRAARKLTLLPWALPSVHCTSTKYRRTCEYLAPFCSKGLSPAPSVWTSTDSTDPGWKAIAASGVDLLDPDVVVLSASSYVNWRHCPENYRILTSGAAPGEESFALDCGSAMHVGIAEGYRQIMNFGLDNRNNVG